MPIIKPDLTEAVKFTVMEDGTYLATIKDADFQTSKEKGTPMVVPTLEIDYRGEMQTRKAYLPITGKGAGGFEQLLRACHFDELADAYSSPEVTDKPEFNTDDLRGQEVQVIVTQSMYNGQMRDNVTGFLRK